jgi:2-oxo-4-hydroxy-4-carboxy-5-ureidoimidazoline decarboxylase
VSALSFREQGYDRAAAPATTTAAEAEVREVAVKLDIDRLNAAYEDRFGFRYCVFVAGRSRAELLPGMREALGRDRASELHRALDAVVDIAQARRVALQGGAG